MSAEKLRRAMQLIQECIDEYQGEESDEGQISEDGEGYEEKMSEPSDMGGNDKIRMAAALMKRGK